MNKLGIDGKLVDCPCEITIPVLKLTPELTPEGKHLFGQCRTLPTYFCPVCAREAMRGTNLADPWGVR